MVSSSLGLAVYKCGPGRSTAIPDSPFHAKLRAAEAYRGPCHGKSPSAAVGGTGPGPERAVHESSGLQKSEDPRGVARAVLVMAGHGSVALAQRLRSIAHDARVGGPGEQGLVIVVIAHRIGSVCSDV